jgi:Ca2+-binding EF-hand superfamily protein
MRKHDSNRNGQIDREEITSAWPEDPDEIDVDGDGILTLSELTNAFAFRRIVRAEIGIIGVDQGWAIKIRNRFDRDQDGKLSADEWTSTPMPSKPEDFDEDDDTRLSLMEIATMLAKHRQKLGLTAKDQLGARALISPFDRDFDGTVINEGASLGQRRLQFVPT